MPNIHRLAAVAIVAFALGALVGCSAAAPQLTGHDYLSVDITEGGAAKSLVDGTRVRLSFGTVEGDDQAVGSLSAHAGCNSIAGSYRVAGGQLIFESAGTTAIGCDPARHAQDEWLSTFLSSKPLIRLVGNDLTLEGATTVVRLLDTEVAEPDLNIVGPTWMVESIMHGNAVTSVPAGAAATIVFKADGSFELDAGCNRGGGTWKLEGSGIAISGVMLTKMACAGAGAQLEGAVLQVIGEGAVQAGIDASVLTLTRGNSGLQLRG